MEANGNTAETVLLKRNEQLLELVRLCETHPNAANRRQNDQLLVELRGNIELLEQRIKGGDKKKKGKKGEKKGEKSEKKKGEKKGEKKEKKSEKKSGKEKEKKKGEKKEKKSEKKSDKEKEKKKEKKEKKGEKEKKSDKKEKKSDKKDKKDKKSDKDEKKHADAGAPSSSVHIGTFNIPMALMADSYKATHFEMYPEARKMVAYGEFRAPYKDLQGKEGRFVSYGMRFLIETYLSHPWTEADVDRARDFYKTHNAGFTPFPFPEDLFRKMVRENGGYFPVKIQALRDGTVAHIHVPVFQVTAEGQYARLVTFLETVLCHVWYPSTVATLSRKCREIIAGGFAKSVDPSNQWLLDSRLHDFGFRGCTCLEQAIIGGSAHLLSFDGSDTMPALYYAQYKLNGGKPVGSSIPASEHSVMTAYSHERQAFAHMIGTYGSGLFSVVMDSYNYQRALDEIVPSLKAEFLAAKNRSGHGFMVFRPDSGEPVEAVLMGLRAADKTFGSKVNAAGFKVPNDVGVIQGDGISVVELDRILNSVLAAGFSAQSVAFGMGSGLLQKLNRDTMSFAVKLSHIVFASGMVRDVMKKPQTDGGKISLPGILRVCRDDKGIPTVYPAEDPAVAAREDLLEVVWDHGPVKGHKWDDFDTMRARVRKDWDALPTLHDPRSASLLAKIKAWVEDHNKHEMK